MRIIGSCGVVVLAVGIALAQRPAFDTFEVATIKRTPEDWRGGRFIRMQTAQQLVARNQGLNYLIAAAYSVSPKAIFGLPKWAVDEKWDILAKVPGGVRPYEFEQMAMLRSLLAERFGLKFHRESREMSIYALGLARGGSKLRDTLVAPDATPEGPPPLVFALSPDLIRMEGRYTTTAELVSVLQRAALERPVVDRTGLKGRYDFELEFTPDESVFGGMVPAPAGDVVKPGLFKAIQEQLGLRLEAMQGPVEAVVVDRAERPSEN